MRILRRTGGVTRLNGSRNEYIGGRLGVMKPVKRERQGSGWKLNAGKYEGTWNKYEYRY